HAARADVVPLGTAVPAPEYLPAEALGRLLARAVRRNPVEASAYDFPPGCLRLRQEVGRRPGEAGCARWAGDLGVSAGAPDAAAQPAGVRPPRQRAPVRLVQQDAGPGLPRRLGGGRPAAGGGSEAEIGVLAGDRDPDAAGGRRLPGQRRLRAPPAAAAARLRR